MKTIYDIYKNSPPLEPLALTIGNFDGFHRGHRKLVNVLKNVALEKNLSSSVMTFYPHPEQVLSSKSKEHFQLSHPEGLKEDLKKEGVDYFFLQEFTKDFAFLSAHDFFYKILLEKMKVKALIIGEDFSFGKDRKGGIKELRDFCEKSSVSLTEVPCVLWKGQRISSTGIRKAAMRSDMESVNFLLGRPFCLSGVVETGERRGKQLGFPTANISCERSEFLRKGVYLTLCELQGKKYNSITNLGYRPTFDSSRTKVYVETHIFEKLSDFYGEMIKIEFLRFLRDEKKFSSPQNLVSQIDKDLKIAFDFFKIRSKN